MFKINHRFLNILVNNVKIHRYKHKENHWSVQKKNKTGTTRALEHFDEYYTPVYKKKWPEIRKALLGKQKHVAVLNNYSDTEPTIKFLLAKGALNMRTLFDLEKGHLQDEYTKNKRQRDLQRIWESEKEETTNPDIKSVEKQEKSSFSLSHSLDNAQIDSSRIIDGHNSTSILYEFVPATKIKGREHFIPENEGTNIYQDSNQIENFMAVEEDTISFPEHLNIFCFEEANGTIFANPRRGSTQVLNYYLMDGASVLPVLALDLQPGSRMLDICSAPGGKSLIALQTLYPDFLRCNDLSISRTNRIFTVMKQYLYDFQERWLDPGKIVVSHEDGRYLQGAGFDRVLVDVPCTTDRHSVREDDNNIFRADRVKERLQLPELQTALLMNALRVVEVGGVVVYSTCSLSPIQNEGVVHMALKKLWEETDVRVKIKDLGRSLAQFRHVFHFSSPKITKYGHLVVPNVSQNYGPMYFCKFQRIK